jgi:hypothetical protein
MAAVVAGNAGFLGLRGCWRLSTASRFGHHKAYRFPAPQTGEDMKHYETVVGFGLAIAWLVLLGGPLGAQTAPPLTVTGGGVATCVPLRVRAPYGPSPDVAWTMRLTWQAAASTTVNAWEADAAPPYDRSRTFSAGSYTIAGRWTATGKADVPIAPRAYSCPPDGAPAPLPPPPPPPTEVCGDRIDNDQDGQVDEGCPTTPPPTPDEPIFGVVDPAILGTCSAAQHDRWVLSGGDGFRYRTWHQQIDPIAGCVYGHEHGDNPASFAAPTGVPVHPVRFGYIGRRHPSAAEPLGHEEPHEGFKVFVAKPGDVSDEGRVNRVYSRSVFHMGTGGPRRFLMPHHSGDIIVHHPEFGLTAVTRLMMNTGGLGAVCDPRTQAPVKDVMQLASPCRLNSGYEIWSTQAGVFALVNGIRTEVYRAFATPAVFDPITVLDRATPTALVYVWDARMDASMTFPGDDRRGARGCQRENYAQPGYWYNGGGPATTYYTDAMGEPLDAAHPLAIAQFVSRSHSVGAPATNDGLVQFKMRVDYCSGVERDRNGNIVRMRAGISGTLDPSKLGLKN